LPKKKQAKTKFNSFSKRKKNKNNLENSKISNMNDRLLIGPKRSMKHQVGKK
jgi:hypothetical protein